MKLYNWAEMRTSRCGCDGQGMIGTSTLHLAINSFCQRVVCVLPIRGSACLESGSPDDRWWFVTPEGNAFLSQGLNHVGPGWVSSDPWKKRLGLEEGHTQIEFLQAMVRRVDSDMKAFGLNTLGTHNRTDWFEEADGSFVPYLKQLYFVNIASWMRSTPDKYVDVFTEEFADFCQQYVEDHVAPYREDPYLSGYTY